MKLIKTPMLIAYFLKINFWSKKCISLAFRKCINDTKLNQTLKLIYYEKNLRSRFWCVGCVQP